MFILNPANVVGLVFFPGQADMTDPSNPKLDCSFELSVVSDRILHRHDYVAGFIPAISFMMRMVSAALDPLS